MVQLGTIQSNQGSRQNRSSELQIIQAFEKQAGGKGPFYLIEKGWWDSWTSFAARKDSAGAQDQNQGNSIVCRPGSIQNSQLVEAEQGAQHLKPGLKENQDFAIVCKESWDQLVLWYGCTGPALERPAVFEGVGENKKQRVMVAPISLKAHCEGFESERTISVCKSSSVAALKQAVCDAFGLDSTQAADYELVDYFRGAKQRSLEDAAASGAASEGAAATAGTDTPSLEDIKLIDGQDVKLVSRTIAGATAAPLDDQTDGSNDGGFRLGSLFDDDVPNTGTAGKRSSAAGDDDDVLNNVGVASRLADSSKAIILPDAGTAGVTTRSGREYGTGRSGGFSSGSGLFGKSGGSYFDDAPMAAPGRGPGLAGLGNLGNTCFMNSSLQCLAHTVPLLSCFLPNRHLADLNTTNPLGMKGELAEGFGTLMALLWKGGVGHVSPRRFKERIGRFAPQFSGYAQHDSQEFLAFLLDGLHEDLNRIKNKPYVEEKDSAGRPDAEVAAEAWANYRLRNDSVVVDHFQGLYKSTLDCPRCSYSSTKFDPFMYLSLPLPESRVRALPVVLVHAAGAAPPVRYVVEAPNAGTLRDVLHGLARLAHISVAPPGSANSAATSAGGAPAGAASAAAGAALPSVDQVFCCVKVSRSNGGWNDDVEVFKDVRTRVAEIAPSERSYSREFLVVYYYDPAAFSLNPPPATPATTDAPSPAPAAEQQQEQDQQQTGGDNDVAMDGADAGPADAAAAADAAGEGGAEEVQDAPAQPQLLGPAVPGAVPVVVHHKKRSSGAFSSSRGSFFSAPLLLWVHPSLVPTAVGEGEGLVPAGPPPGSTKARAGGAYSSSSNLKEYEVAGRARRYMAQATLTALAPFLTAGGAAARAQAGSAGAGAEAAAAGAGAAAGEQMDRDGGASEGAAAAAGGAGAGPADDPLAMLARARPASDIATGSNAHATPVGSSGQGSPDAAPASPTGAGSATAAATVADAAWGSVGDTTMVTSPAAPAQAAAGDVEMAEAGAGGDGSTGAASDTTAPTAPGPQVQPFNMWAKQEEEAAAVPAELPEWPPSFRLLAADHKGDVQFYSRASPLDGRDDEGWTWHVVMEWMEGGATFGVFDVESMDAPEEHESARAHAERQRTKPPVSLTACVEAFLQPEQLSEEDSWYCPKCKDHVQADKKLDLWSLPEVLVVCLKRFSYTRHSRDKLETPVEFGMTLDLSPYLMRHFSPAAAAAAAAQAAAAGQAGDAGAGPASAAAGEGQDQAGSTPSPTHYTLYAVINHFGSLGGGHYTAYSSMPGTNQWHAFDDSRVSPISQDEVCSPAAYVLFFRRTASLANDPPNLVDALRAQRGSMEVDGAPDSTKDSCARDLDQDMEPSSGPDTAGPRACLDLRTSLAGSAGVGAAAGAGGAAGVRRVSSDGDCGAGEAAAAGGGGKAAATMQVLDGAAAALSQRKAGRVAAPGGSSPASPASPLSSSPSSPRGNNGAATAATFAQAVAAGGAGKAKAAGADFVSLADLEGADLTSRLQPSKHAGAGADSEDGDSMGAHSGGGRSSPAAGSEGGWAGTQSRGGLGTGAGPSSRDLAGFGGSEEDANNMGPGMYDEDEEGGVGSHGQAGGGAWWDGGAGRSGGREEDAAELADMMGVGVGGGAGGAGAPGAAAARKGDGKSSSGGGASSAANALGQMAVGADDGASGMEVEGPGAAQA